MRWFLENWRLIIDILSVIIVTIFFFIKKKPIKLVDSVKTIITIALPELIRKVENYKDVFDPSRKLTGDEKLHMVIDSCKCLLMDECGIKEDELCLYNQFIIETIEDILSTPQKKGEICDGKE